MSAIATIRRERKGIFPIAASANGHHADGSAKVATTTLSPVAIKLSDVVPVNVRWLWPDRIPLGRVTVLAGRPGVGKSFISIDIAARVSRGVDWPDGTACPDGSVLMLAAEDDIADTIRPRLDAAGADCSRIIALQGTEYRTKDGGKGERAITLADLDVLVDQLDKMPDCRVAIVDPIGSYLGGGVDSHRDNEVRGALGGLAKLGRDRDIAIIIVAHARKGGASHADDSILGSVAFSGLARSVLHAMPDPDDPSKRRKLLAAGKCNLAPPSATWSWEITRPVVVGNAGAVGWIGPVETTADDAMAKDRERPGPPDDEYRRAVDWLIRRLEGGPALARDVSEEWQHGENGSKRTLDRAKSDAKVKAYRPDNPGPWYWRLEGAHCQAHAQDKERGDLGNLGHVQKTPGKREKNTAGTRERGHIAKSICVGDVTDDDSSLAKLDEWNRRADEKAKKKAGAA